MKNKGYVQNPKKQTYKFPSVVASVILKFTDMQKDLKILLHFPIIKMFNHVCKEAFPDD